MLIQEAGAVYLATWSPTAPGLLATAAVLLGLALALVVSRRPGDLALLQRVATGGLLGLPGALVVYFSFSAGGFFPDAPAFVALVLLAALVLRATLAEDPFGGFSRPLAIATTAMALYTGWTLLSGLWSDAPGRALIEGNRALVYLLALVLLGSLPRTTSRLAWMLRGVAAAMVLVSVAALVSRLLPDILATDPNIANDRLSYPLTYWNALGILGSLALILCLWLTTSLREARIVRVLAAASLPAVAAMVLFTFSRGAIAAGAIGIVAYLLLARPRGIVTVLFSALPLTVVGLASAYGATLLATTQPTTSAAISQGHHVGVVLGLCTVGAAFLRVLLLPLDERLLALRLEPRLRRRVIGPAWGLAVVAAIVVSLAVHLPARVDDEYRRFVVTTNVAQSSDLRERLTDPANSGRVDHWRLGMRAFREHASLGIGAGTFGLLWTQERPASLVGLVVEDAHSLYVETLAELGVVGMALLTVTLLTILTAFMPVRRREDRALHAALTAAALAWLVHAGVDWDWEMPAVTIWLFALGGLALAADGPRPPRPAPAKSLRIRVGVAAVLAATGPALVLTSEKRLDRAVDAFYRGDCLAATGAAASAASVLDHRPEP
ncbi:MAG TPA: O-antigen ligase family protein, partial [Solirubrobacteraceae bacterium]|nr:O-antigen ligase family protein [Solirubrobacteraceae bacterium]